MSDDPRRLTVVQPGAAGTIPATGEPPVFERVAIVGLGLIGGSIALAARQLWPAGLVIGVDEKTVLERAMVRHAIDVAADDPVVMAEADLVILAAPVRDNLTILADLEQHVPGRAVVTDVGSAKRDIVAAARALPARFTFIGGHPLGGAPRSGIDQARPDLFRARPWLFTPADDRHPESLDRLRRFVTALGATPHVVTAEAHDRLMAFLSHLPQLTASALMHVVGEEIGAEGLSLSGRGLADTTRLASSPADIWRDICATNADEIRMAIDRLISELEALRNGLSDGDAIDRVFESAAAWREVVVAGGSRAGGRTEG